MTTSATTEPLKVSIKKAPTSDSKTKSSLNQGSPFSLSHASRPLDSFARRHLGSGPAEVEELLKVVHYKTLDELTDQAIPADIRLNRSLNLPAARSESEALSELSQIAHQNQVFRSYIGQGYYGTITPPVIHRNILESPGWYTSYTPYQAEISQGRLEALLNFQTLVTDLTGLPIANASLLDEGTAAAEAVSLCFAAKGDAGNGSHSQQSQKTKLFVSQGCHPQTINIVKTRAKPLGVEVVVGHFDKANIDNSYFGALVQYPTTYGTIHDYSAFAEKIHSVDALLIVAADPLSLTLLKPPGEFGADVAVGSMQRFGVPMGFGGPHAAYFATRDEFKRLMPGRLIGVSKDAHGNPAYRLSLQAREQHIRRDKATSNICTAQALLAVMASMYACYHGPIGLRQIARRIHTLTKALASGLTQLGYQLGSESYFDTITVKVGAKRYPEIEERALNKKINFRKIDDSTFGISLDETVNFVDLQDIWTIFHDGQTVGFDPTDLIAQGLTSEAIAPIENRTSSYLTHPIFYRYHTETEMMRYLKRLEAKDLSLTTSMIPLGSCTMKLNAAAEMLPITWPEFNQLHPYAPNSQTKGYEILCHGLEKWLSEITGFAAISLQPNAGSQGEYAGLLAIRGYHEARGQGHRNVCLIPTSAHGTNPASATLAGYRVVAVQCDKQGNIDLDNLRARAEEHKDMLAALMITYPSTHGVFETSIQKVADIVHEFGGQVYMDGANMNAQIGLCRPGDYGMDVCHLNLHKTFCIPHGGGGPGVGPVCVAEHLIPYIPNHSLTQKEELQISAAPYGSANILIISWMFIAMMSSEGLTAATQLAVLNANYIAKRLENHYPILFRGNSGLIAHECIIDLRGFKASAGVEVEDVAKRLMDYGFHAPTISWPVPGTMMIEPTESESKEELDRFCEAMLSIHQEIKEIEEGRADRKDNPLKNAPHTSVSVTADEWIHPYSRSKAAYPAPWLQTHKFWPPVGRIDNVYGDRNLFCSCVPMSQE